MITRVLCISLLLLFTGCASSLCPQTAATPGYLEEVYVMGDDGSVSEILYRRR